MDHLAKRYRCSYLSPGPVVDDGRQGRGRWRGALGLGPVSPLTGRATFEAVAEPS